MFDIVYKTWILNSSVATERENNHINPQDGFQKDHLK